MRTTSARMLLAVAIVLVQGDVASALCVCSTDAAVCGCSSHRGGNGEPVPAPEPAEGAAGSCCGVARNTTVFGQPHCSQANRSGDPQTSCGRAIDPCDCSVHAQDDALGYLQSAPDPVAKSTVAAAGVAPCTTTGSLTAYAATARFAGACDLPPPLTYLAICAFLC